jgi:hypothetical protein
MRAAGPGTTWNSVDVVSTKGRLPGTVALNASGNLPIELATSQPLAALSAPSPSPPRSWT